MKRGMYLGGYSSAGKTKYTTLNDAIKVWMDVMMQVVSFMTVNTSLSGKMETHGSLRKMKY